MSQSQTPPGTSPEAHGVTPWASTAPWRCLSIDVEEYFQVEAAQSAGIGREQWDHWPSRVERNVDLLLTLFNRHKRKGTFFILGCIARTHPGLVRRIAAAGHEIAAHGMWHERLHRLTPDTLRRELTDCKKLLEDQGQTPVQGFRAPTFSIVPTTAWAIDVLLEAGYQYDSSIFQVRHPSYGVPLAPDHPYLVRQSAQSPTLLEIPPLSWRVLGRNIPVAGGGYFRLLPLWFMRRGLRQAARQGRPAVLYFHPWEFDPEMPRLPLSRTGRLRTYTNLHKAQPRLEAIMAQHARWTPIADMLAEVRNAATQRPVFTLNP